MAAKLKLRPKDAVIAIIGPSGTGKSSFINTATQAQPGLATSTEDGILATCTKSLGFACCSHPTDASRRIIFIDTPPLESKDDLLLLGQNISVYLNKKEFLERLFHLFSKTEGVRMSGAIYLRRITDNRATDRMILENLRKNRKFSEARLVLGTTMWDSEPDETEDERLTELRDFWQEGDKLGESYREDVMQYLNTKESAWDIINKLI